MKMKRISAANMKDAMTLARTALGDDVVLIDTQKTISGVIVTFAIDNDVDLPLAAFADAPTPLPPSTAPKPALAKTDTADEYSQPTMALLDDALSFHSLSPALRTRILDACKHGSTKTGTRIDVAERTLAQALTSSVRFAPLDTKDTTPPERGWMFVGPHGAGKTSTIAKLATELALKKQPVHLITTDTERLGGALSLELLADMLQCPFMICESRAQLKQILAQSLGKAWVLIDSSGANIYEFAPLKLLGEFASLQDVEPILTCPAGMDADEAIEMASVFNFIRIERMLVTRLDSVRRLGGMFGALTSGGYALSSFTNSAIPTDTCRAMTPPTLAKLMLRHARERLTHEPRRSNP